MCGHDGHVTCLLAFVMRFLDDAHNIPSNKTVRLLFRPSEEGPGSGAKVMVQEGCMEGVDEVYGFHNWPTSKAGELWILPGAVMSSIVILKIRIIGTMGHGS
jgi:hippurate hydrolase